MAACIAARAIRQHRGSAAVAAPPPRRDDRRPLIEGARLPTAAAFDGTGVVTEQQQPLHNATVRSGCHIAMIGPRGG